MGVSGAIIGGSLLGGAASLGGAALQSGAATSAANVQSQAAEEAAQLQYQEAQQALGFEEQQYKNTLGLEEPGYLAGTQGLSTLSQLLGLSAESPNMSIFENPLGSLQQPGAASTPTSGFLTPGLGVGNLGLGASGLTLGGQSITPMQAESAQAIVPSSGMTPAQQAAAIEGFAPAGSAAGAAQMSTVPLSSLAGSTSGTFESPNPRFNPNSPIQGGPATYQGPGGTVSFNGPGGTTIGTGTLPGTNGGTIFDNPGTGAQSTVPINGGNVPGTSLPAGYLSQTWNTPFVAPTAQQAAQMPGYQFQLQQGEQAIQNSAAATGGLLSGGTAKALDQYSQGLASTDYQNLYNQALTQYQQAYNIFNQNQANVFNRYAALAGIGQTSAQQLSNAGLTTGSNVGNTLLTSGAQIGQQLNNAAAAQASGYIGSANAYGGAISSLGSLGQTAYLASLLGNQANASLNV